MDTDVIVAGGGPTGLMLAYELGLAGVRTTVLERLPERTGLSKALNLQPRSAEILDLRGLLDPLLGEALDLVPAGHFAGLGVPLDYTALDTRHPYQVGIPQARVEALLEDHVTRQGGAVARGHTLTGLVQDPDGVTATITTATGASAMTCRFLVGCDGGRSTVRKLAGVPFPGRDPRVRAVVADVALADPGGAVPETWSLPSLTPRDGRVLTIVPLSGGMHRVIFAGPEQQTIDRDAPVTDDEVRAALHGAYGGRLTLRHIRWASRFTDAARQAERYRDGRVLLAGDAAHIHAPTGGQGLNLGLQDAFNLGWKLAAQVRGHAPAGLLDSYHDERHPVAARVLAYGRAQGVLSVPDDDVAALCDVVTDLLALPDTNRHLAETVSGLGIRYPMPDAPDDPLLGRRLPDIDLITPAGPTRPSLLTRTGTGVHLVFRADGPAPAVRHPGVTYATARPVDHPSMRDLEAVLVRPDGYVCWAARTGGEPAPAAAALARWFGAPVPA